MMKLINKFTFFAWVLFTLSSCVFNQGHMTLTAPSRALPSTTMSVSKVAFVNNQLVITGTRLGSVQKIKIEKTNFYESFSIVSQSDTKIIANSLRAIQIAVDGAFNLVMSSAYATSTFVVDFSICNATLNGKGFDCTVTAQDKDILAFDNLTQKWKPKPFNLSGLTYQGSIDASGGPANPGSPNPGDYWIISAAGTVGGAAYSVGDWLVFSNNSTWDKVNALSGVNLPLTGGTLSGDLKVDTKIQLKDSTTNYVTIRANLTTTPYNFILPANAGVNGQFLTTDGNGNLTWTNSSGLADTDALTEGATNLYFTNARAITALTPTLGSYATTASVTTAVAGKEPTITNPNDTTKYYRGDKSFQTLNTTAVTEGSNLYFTTTRAVTALKGANFGGIATITGIADPMASGDIVNLGYLNTSISGLATAANLATTNANVTALQTLDAAKLPLAGGTMSGDLKVDTKLLLKDGTTNYVTVKANATTTPYNFILPASAGSNGQVLSTDGAGNLSWGSSGIQSITAGTGLTGGTISTTGTIAVDVGTTANKILQLNGSAQIPAVDGSLLTNINPSNLSGAVTVAKGGTGLTAGTSGGIPYYSATNAMTSSGLLGANGIMIGGGAGAAPTTISTGTSGYILTSAGASAPTWTQTLPLTNGGTGSTTASGARTALGLGTAAVVNTGSILAGAIPLLGTNGIVGSNLCAGDNSGGIICNTMPSSTIAGTVSDETGTGVLVFGTAPTITNPVIANIAPAADFTLTQNAVAPFKSVNTGAVLDTLVLKTGLVGIGTATPQSKLDVNGAIRVGADGTACSASISGAMRFNTPNVEYCNGTSWAAFAAAGAGGVQSLPAPGTSGTAPAWSAAGTAYTLNIPMASTALVTAGLLSKTDYDIFNAKLGTASTFTGDVSGTSSTTSVDKIKGTAVSAAASANSQFLVYSGAQYVPVAMSGDATMATSGAVTLKNTGTSGTYVTVTTDAQGRITSGANTSAALAAAITDETGTGALVFGTAPTIANPVITNIAPGADFTLTQAGVAPFTSVNTSAAANTLVLKTGFVGVGTSAPATAVDVNGAISQRGMAAPAVSVAGQGRMYFDSTSNTFKVSQNNGAYVDLVGSTGVQTLPTPGSTGTAPSWSQAGTAFTLEIPMAATALVTAGLLSKTDYDIFNAKAGTASPTFTGVPLAPTAAANTNTTQIATTAFVLAQAGTATPLIDGVAAVGTATLFAREDHKHPTDTTRAASGANGDITSLTALSTAITIAQGGTGATTNTQARTNLGLGTAAVLNTGTIVAGTIPLLGTNGIVSNKLCSGDNAGTGLVCNSLPSSVIAGTVSDATGTGALVFGTSPAIANIAPAADFTLTQNAVAPFKSVNTSAVLDTLVLKTGQVGIGTATPAATAVLDISSTTKGLLIPRMTTAQRTPGIVNPANGLQVYDTDLSTIFYYNGSGWVALAAAGAGGVQTLPAPGTSGTAPAWSNGGTTAYTLNIPMASTALVTAGLLSKTDYDIFNAKLGTASTFTGDVSGTSSTTSVDKIKGTAVSAAASANSQFLVYSGAQYVPVAMSGDATMATSGAVTLKNTGTSGTYVTVTTDAQGRITSGANTSAALAAAITDETGTGALVFGTAPTIANPVITNIAPGADFTLTQAGVAPFTSVNTSAVANTLVLKTGFVGIGTNAPTTALDVNGTYTQRGIAAPSKSIAGQGTIYFDSTSNTFKVSQNNGNYVDLLGSVGVQTLPIPGTTGTAPSWSQSGTAFTLEIPMAATASVTAGLLSKTDYDIFNAKAGTASPTFTGVPLAPTAAANTNTTQIATTAFVLAQAGTATPLIDGVAAVGTATLFAREDHKHPTDTTREALLVNSAGLAAALSDETGTGSAVFSASPALTGNPTAPTQATNDSSTKIATTAFVTGQAGIASPIIDGTAAAGTSLLYARQDHVHPTDTTRAPAAGSSSITSVGTITSGTWNGTTIAVANGGTGATDAATARSNFGLGTAAVLNTGTVVAGTIPLLGTNGIVSNKLCSGDNAGTGIVCNSLPSSVLAGTVSDATGTGALVFGTSPAIANIAPAADFTLTQNAVAPFKSVNTGAVLDTLVLKAGLVGIGTATPQSKLDVNGAIRVGADATACSASISGAMRFNTPNVEYCNGTSWAAFAAAGAGGVQSLPAPGTSGTAPAWSAAGTAYTLNIPMASTALVTAGLLSKTDYDLFAAKQGVLTNSAGLAAALSDETGTGFAVFSASPTFTGVPLAPTAAVNTNTTQIATTAFVLAQTGTATPLIDGVAAVGTATLFAREDHKHPTDTTREALLVNSAGLAAALSDETGTGAAVFATNPAIPNITPGADFTLTQGASVVPFTSVNTGATANTLYLKTGFVGIGTNAPTTALDVNGTYTQRGIAAPVKSVAGQGTIYFDSTSNTFKVSQNNGNYIDLLGSVGVQTLPIPGTTGTAPSWSQSGTAFTLEIPMAATALVTAGLLSKTDYDLFAAKAPTASPTFTGVPLAPTAAVNTNTTQLATTAFVLAQAGTATPLIDSVAAVGTATLFAREDHVHPTDTSRAPAAGSSSITSVGTITSGTWNGTTIAIANGGTGATDAATARSNFGLGSAAVLNTGTIVAGTIPLLGINGIVSNKLCSGDNSGTGIVCNSLPSSVLAGTVSDATGTGALVFGTSPAIANIAPGADFTLTQNTVVPFTSVNTGAVVNTLVLKTGFVGVGTSAPATAVDVNGAISERGMAAPAVSVAGQGRIYFDSTSNTFKVSQNNGAYIDLFGGSTSLTTVGTITAGVWNGTTIALANGGTGAVLAPATAGGIPWFSSTTAMGVVAAGTSGSVLLSGGTGTPTWSTVLLSGGNITMPAAASSITQAAAATGDLTISTTNAHNILLSPNTTGNVTIASTSGGVYAPAFYYNSDRRLKENIHDINGLETILGLRGVAFTWKHNGEPELGLIAQEVEKVVPQLVKTNPETGIKSVKYGNLVAPLIEAVKQMYAMLIKTISHTEQIDRKIASESVKTQKLETEVEKLKAENARLKADVEEIKKSLQKHK